MTKNKVSLVSSKYDFVVESEGTQNLYKFGNYGASAVEHSGSYGVELAVVEYTLDSLGNIEDYTLVYPEEIVGDYYNDVIGFIQNVEELDAHLTKIKALSQ